MLPRIKKVEFRNFHVGDEVFRDSDLLLHAKGVETVDPSHKISGKDFEKMLLHEPDVAIFGIGFKEKVTIDSSVLDAAKKHKIEIYALPTKAAAKKFQELARKGKKVVAKLHITC